MSNADPFVVTWPKKCSCCARFLSEEDWENLRYVGIQRGSKQGSNHVPDLELRSCSCNTTLAVTVPDDFID